jgi:ribonuclease Z
MQIVFLGTSCAKPTKERNHSAIFVSHGSDGILFDCGEGTQRQFAIAGIKPTKVNRIIISHWHGDHVLGLPGFIQTLGISEYNKTLKIYGPIGTKKRLEEMLKAVVFENRIEMEVFDVEEGKFVNAKDYYIEAGELEHKTPTLGFRFIEKDKRRINVAYIRKLGIPEGPLLGKLQEGETITWKGEKISPKDATYVVKGKVLCYLPDSLPTTNSIKLAQDADLLICEATYSSQLEEKAKEHMHMTSKQAALVASNANVKKLVLTHFSPRYKDAHELEEDAKDIFNDVVAAHDFMKINL